MSAVFLTAASLAIPSHALACGDYGRTYEKHVVREQKSYLNYADVVLTGTWRQLRSGEKPESSDEPLISGYLIPDEGGETKKIALSFFPEINCGFPSFPQESQHGTFFLRADISPGNYLDDTVDYELLHFISDRKRH